MSRVKQTNNILPLPRAPDSLSLAILQALPDAVLAIAQDGSVEFSNHAAQAFFTIGEKALAGRKLAELTGADSPACGLEGLSITLHDLEIAGQRVESVSAVPLEEGRTLLVIRTSRAPMKNDWTAKIKNSIKPAQHLARILGHEIKNPLTGIRGAAQLLATSVQTADDRELAELISNETARLFRMVEKVNVFEDAPREQYRALNIHAVLDHVEKIARSGLADGIDTQRRYDPSLPEIHGHEDRLVQAVLNLVKNASEAGATNIILHTSYDLSGKIHPESLRRLPVCVAVEDNGAGIKPEVLKDLFQPYMSTKAAGDGLGLAIVSKIIDDHGGTMDVASHPGKTIFKINLPRGDAK
ncbi:MAG TPA: ATP-binding protein [Patescibacteria group bacterium]|nr:ATP-binding protein [Patescibacteria group bacterium]